jgi:SAM-dependent methyltransferase
LARKIRIAFQSSSLNQVLPPHSCQFEIVPSTNDHNADQGSTFPCEFVITNSGKALLSGRGTHPLRLRATWRSVRRPDLEVFREELDFPKPLFPGDAARVSISLKAPPLLGTFFVDWHIVQGDCVLTSHCSDHQKLVVRTRAKPSEDIDYHLFYSQMNLEKNFWHIVGPSTREEFERLANTKHDQLIKLGMTPNSRVLDVGCGTGQLAMTLDPYLSDRGSYVGTDIGPEAITFCKERYKRPNFRFAVNEMTSLPIRDELFEFITFFSVFTHTYPDETVLILAEAKRLLAEKGIILADVFTSSLIERCEGNRGAMELNRDHFLRLVGVAGLTATRHQHWKWKDHSEREVYIITHHS